MAGTTTYYGISYPTNTDYVKDGATAMQTIADGFDSAVAIPTYNNQTGTSYTFVLADAGKTVTSNNASAVTFTIPPQASVAWANNTTLTVRNLGAGVVTIAGGSGVTVTNTAQTVAQYGEVKLIRTASNAWTVVPASGSPSGLTLLNTTTFTTSSAVAIDGVFSSTYDNYKIIIKFTAASATDAEIRWYGRSGSPAADTTTNYHVQSIAATGSATGAGYQAVGKLGDIGTTNATWAALTAEFFSPNLAELTRAISQAEHIDGAGNNYYRAHSNWQNSTTQFTGIKIYPSTGTISGTATIYGYQK